VVGIITISKIIHNFGFKDYFHVGLTLISPFVTEECSIVMSLQSVAETLDKLLLRGLILSRVLNSEKQLLLFCTLVLL